MSDKILFDKIVKILENEFEVEKSKIKITSSFYFDLKLDSLDLVDFTLALEKETKLVIPVERLKDVSKIEDMISLVKQL